MSPLSQYVRALTDIIHVKIKTNLLQPRSFDRDEHYAQTEEQIFTLSDYIALAVIKESIAGKDKLCQSWRPALTLKWVSWLTGKGSQVQEWESYAGEQVSPIYHFLFWEGMETTENLSLKSSQVNYVYWGLFSALGGCELWKAAFIKLCKDGLAVLTVGFTQPVAPRQPQEQAQAKNHQCLAPVGSWAQPSTAHRGAGAAPEHLLLSQPSASAAAPSAGPPSQECHPIGPGAERQPGTRAKWEKPRTCCHRCMLPAPLHSMAHCRRAIPPATHPRLVPKLTGFRSLISGKKRVLRSVEKVSWLAQFRPWAYLYVLA